MGVSKRVFCSLGVWCKGSAGLRLIAGIMAQFPGVFLGLVPHGTQPMFGGTSPVLTWAEGISWEPQEIPEDLNLLGHKIIWKWGPSAILDTRIPKD